MNQILALNKPQEVDMLLNKWSKPNKTNNYGFSQVMNKNLHATLVSESLQK